MSNAAENLPDDPASLKAMIVALRAENAKMSATLQAHDQLIQSLRLRIARLKKQVFGKSSEKIEREIQQLELALEDLLIATAESDAGPINEADEAAPGAPVASVPEKILRRRPRVSEKAVRERKALDPGARARAATSCAAAGSRAAKAWARADKRQVWEARIAAINAVSAAMAAYNRFRATRGTDRSPVARARDNGTEDLYLAQIEAALACVRKLRL